MVSYKIHKGVRKIRTKLKLSISSAFLGIFALLMGAILPLSAKAANPTFTLTPSTFVGAVNDCGPGYPAGTPGGVVSKWDNSTGNLSPSLLLQKNVPTTDCSSAGATINGVSGITLSELNFDFKTGEYCGAGAPRFNVSASDGFHFMGGCSNGTQTDLGNGWTHVVINPSNPAQAFPVMSASATVNSIEIVFDEQGSTHIDNISINNQVIGGPNTPASKDDCKKDGWKTLQDANGNSFKNQGDCVSYVATKGKNPANG